MKKKIAKQVKVSLVNSKGDTFRMTLQRPGYIEDMIHKHGSWEPHLSDFLSKFISDGSVFLDIGANIGYHSLYLASLYSNATVMSFEPHPKIYQQLSRNVEINKFKNVLVYNKAVGDTKGSVDFYMQDIFNYNRGLSCINYDSSIGNKIKKIKVDIVALDEFLNEDIKKKVRVLKIDTQGYEYHVLQGALNLLQKSQPVIAFELHHNTGPQLEDILKLIPNYNVYKIEPWSGEVRKVKEPDPPNFANDYICVPHTLDV
ncbi:FkbM family methyltransferase [Alkalihalobacterium alkalinitrilicum]|uniref:FkbM family methyltransferase n=1 Tax=Alkalihalobacterium alkalinitrilicum TaxID=427920 RepID=UPI0009953520|nr:FkbM family methyltransferase [Alkalihalobacterium alkalinitrilicum]